MIVQRRVRRVNLRAPTEALLRRGAIHLEDALRTASFASGSPARVVIVRHLDVGAIDPDKSPAALAIRIEDRLRELSTRLVHASSPSAEGAPAVYFRDPVEPAIFLAEHAARTTLPAPWFLARAVPAYRPGLGPRHAFRAALAAARDASPDGLVAFVEALFQRDPAIPVLRALDEIDGSGLLEALGIAPPNAPISLQNKRNSPHASPSAPPPATPRSPSSAPTPHDPAAPAAAHETSLSQANDVARDPPPPPDRTGALAAPSLSLPISPFEIATMSAPRTDPTSNEIASISAEFRAALASHVPLWGPADHRSIWLAAAALLARSPAARHDPRMAARAAALASAFASPAASPRPLSPPRAPDATPPAASPSPASAPAIASAAFAPAPSPAPWPLPEGAWSAAGGLLFLLPLLARLEIAAFLAREPALADAAFPLHLLHHLARRLSVAPDDPILVALGEPPFPLPDVPFTEPAAFARIAGPAPRGALASPLSAPSHGGLRALAAFHTALRRTVRRTIRIGLRALVFRPARVFATRTHLDLALDLRRVHLGVRRAGADLDPGYLPWLGRVVTFHYRHAEEPRA